MKAKYFIVTLLLVAGCNKKNANKESEMIDSSNIVLRDTIYIKNDSAIVPEDIYLNLDSISIGNPFTDKNGTYGFYRLIFSSSEETQKFHIEKMQIVGDGIIKLKKRFEVPTGILGKDFALPSIGLIRWETPEIIEININGNKRIKLNISKMEAVELTNN